MRLYSPPCAQLVCGTSWRVLRTIHESVAKDRVLYTVKARAEMGALCIDETDAAEILSGLSASDYHQTLQSDGADEQLWVFKPLLFRSSPRQPQAARRRRR